MIMTVLIRTLPEWYDNHSTMALPSQHLHPSNLGKRSGQRWPRVPGKAHSLIRKQWPAIKHLHVSVYIDLNICYNLLLTRLVQNIVCPKMLMIIIFGSQGLNCWSMTWAILWARPDSFEPSTFAGNKHGSEFSQKLEDDMRLFLEPSPQLSTMFLRGSGRVCGAFPTLAKSHGGCVLVAGNDRDDGDWGWV